MGGGENMKIAVAASAVVLLAGCASITKEYAALDGKVLSPSDETPKAFETLMMAVGQDRAVLLDRANIYNKAEAGFGLAVLAAAAYGAFNTTYGGNNLKDAAFAAASLASLRTFATPSSRRDAYLEAAAHLNCLHESAQVFVKRTPERFAYRSSMTLESLRPRSASAGYSQSPTPLSNLANALINVESMPRKEAAAFGVSPAVEGFASGAGNRLVEAIRSEEDIFEERFSIVSSEYLEIIGELFAKTKFSAATYATEIENYKKAVKAEVANENAGKDAAAVAQLLNLSVGIRLEDDAKKFAEAKAAIEACSGA